MTYLPKEAFAFPPRSRPIVRPAEPFKPSPSAQLEVPIIEGERIVFTEEGGQPRQYLKLIASGDLDDALLEALADFVKRQRRRLGLDTR